MTKHLDGLFYTPDQEDPVFTDIVEIDLSKVEANLSGPKRPQDLIPLTDRAPIKSLN